MKVVVLMEHVVKDGTFKVVRECTLRSGTRAVDGLRKGPQSRPRSAPGHIRLGRLWAVTARPAAVSDGEAW
jgi:hypothetical protein